MANVRLMYKRGSQSCKSILENTKIKRYAGPKIGADVLLNYGLAGSRKEAWLKAWPSGIKIPKINAKVGYSKLYVIQKMAKSGICVPESRLSLNKNFDLDKWIEKRVNSSGGKGICKARSYKEIPNKYYQKRILDREYELRIHAFAWMPINTWVVIKRVGSKDEIAWNFSQGGHFINIIDQKHKYFNEAREVTKEVLGLLDMSFGAADFIMTKDRVLYFIEINSQPGLSGLSNNTYYQAFNHLVEMDKKEVLKYANGT